MIRTWLPTLIALEIFCGSQLIASEEEHLHWQEVKITSPDRKDTGKVVFSAKTDGKTYLSIDIEAFGKSHAVPKDVLERLAEYPLSSLTTTHEAGYERLGGHTVHFKFRRVDFSTRVPIEHTMTLSVSKGQGVKLSGPSQKSLAAAN